MTKVEFHTGLADPLRFACRLLRKAYRQGASVAVTAPAATLAALDRELWVFEAQDFVPHRRVATSQGADRALQRTPIWLVDSAWSEDCPSVLINLGSAAPAPSEKLERVIEIVSGDPDDMREARARWREYEARGLRPEHHKAGPEAPAEGHSSRWSATRADPR